MLSHSFIDCVAHFWDFFFSKTHTYIHTHTHTHTHHHHHHQQQQNFHHPIAWITSIWNKLHFPLLHHFHCINHRPFVCCWVEGLCAKNCSVLNYPTDTPFVCFDPPPPPPTPSSCTADIRTQVCFLCQRSDLAQLVHHTGFLDDFYCVESCKKIRGWRTFCSCTYIDCELYLSFSALGLPTHPLFFLVLPPPPFAVLAYQISGFDFFFKRIFLCVGSTTDSSQGRVLCQVLFLYRFY